MTIKVYWSTTPEFVANLRAQEPESVLKREILKKKARDASVKHQKGERNSEYEKCPAYQDVLRNIYSINSAYDFDFYVENDKIKSKNYTAEQIGQRIDIRSADNRLFGINHEYILFTEESSLKVNILPAFMESEGFAKENVVIPGTIDIGKWFRPLDCAWHFTKYSGDSFSIKQGDPLYYLQFETEDKIEFVQFDMTQDLTRYMGYVLNSKFFKTKLYRLEDYYNMFTKNKLKNKIVSEIKKNIL